LTLFYNWLRPNVLYNIESKYACASDKSNTYLYNINALECITVFAQDL